MLTRPYACRLAAGIPYFQQQVDDRLLVPLTFTSLHVSPAGGDGWVCILYLQLSDASALVLRIAERESDVNTSGHAAARTGF